MEGGRLRKLEVGEEVRRAQSRGEWLGVRRTFLRGLEGMEVWVGGGAREGAASEEEGLRFGRGERLGRGPRAGVLRVDVVDVGVDRDLKAGRGFNRGGTRDPVFEARCAEFAAGKEGISGSDSESRSEGEDVEFVASREKMGI